MSYEDNPKSIKYYVKKYLLSNRHWLVGKKVVDVPAGNGITSRILQEIGAVPIPFDLFPEYFRIQGLTCKKADLMEGVPLDDKAADMVICQEGIEHFSDQLKTLKEFNRILKPKGTLLITTPNYSNLRSKLSYLLSESERFNSLMPPNEADSIWMTDDKKDSAIYHGHIFLTGILHLRILAVLAGFKIKKIHPTRLKSTSLLLFLLYYPWIYLSNTFTYFKNKRKKDKRV